MRRVWAYLVSVALMAAVLWPMFRSPPVDSYPLSTYPMFSRQRPRFADIQHLVAVDAEGQRRVVPPGLVASGEVLQVKVAIAATVRRGKKAAAKLCREVAARLAEDEDWADAVRVELRRDRYDAHRYFDGATEPVRSKVHARCPVRPPS